MYEDHEQMYSLFYLQTMMVMAISQVDLTWGTKAT